MSKKLIVFGALFAREILRVDSPVSNIIYVPHVGPPRLPWRKCRDIFVGQHMTRHKKSKATVRPPPKYELLLVFCFVVGVLFRSPFVSFLVTGPPGIMKPYQSF